MSYQSVTPNSARDAYAPGEIIDFIINLPADREIVMGSFWLSGNLKVYPAGTGAAVMTGTEQIFYDAKAGMHALISQAQSSLDGQNLENFPHYARFVKQDSVCQEPDIQACGDLANACALKLADDGETNCVLGVSGVGAGGRSFSIKPMICINRSFMNITPDKGEIKVSFILASTNQFLFGADVDPDTTYQLNDLLFSYRTVPLATKGPLVMRTVSALKQILTSSSVNLSVNNPIPSSSLSMSFIPTADESTATANYLRMAEVPTVSRVEFAFNDVVAGGLISYPLETREEILYNFVQSHGGTTKWAVRQDGTNYGIGISYGEALPNLKLGVSIQSGVQSNAPMSCYMYFKGMITVAGQQQQAA